MNDLPWIIATLIIFNLCVAPYLAFLVWIAIQNVLVGKEKS